MSAGVFEPCSLSEQLGQSPVSDGSRLGFSLAFPVTYFVDTAFPEINWMSQVVGDDSSFDFSPRLRRHKDWPRRFWNLCQGTILQVAESLLCCIDGPFGSGK